MPRGRRDGSTLGGAVHPRSIRRRVVAGVRRRTAIRRSRGTVPHRAGRAGTRMLMPTVAVVGSTYLFGTWLAGLSVAAILLVWKLLRTDDGPSVLALALTFQWVQVTVGIFYHAVTGAELDAIYDSDYQTMVLLGLGCVMSLTLGLWGGIRMMAAAHHAPPDDAPESVISWRTLLIVYVGAIAATATIQELAWRFPALTQ